MSKKLWGGRFKGAIDKEFDLFQKSIAYDWRLAKYDVLHSLIHTSALKYAGILTQQETKRLQNVLKALFYQIAKGKFKPDMQCEDIHTDIQNRVEKKTGKLALKLHTLRSRNDQIVFDEQCYCFYEARSIQGLLKDCLASLAALMGKYKESFIVGYTHTQQAQVVWFKDYAGAFYHMAAKDYGRLKGLLDSVSIFIGSGALAGSSIPANAYKRAINKWAHFAKKECMLKKPKPVANSLENVSSRDFIIDFLSALSVIQMHISRMAQDLILFSTKEFNFIVLPEEFCTGSSLMPHKKNPDFLELVRGNTGKIYGSLLSILTTMKGLALTYNRDMQLDKEPLFNAVDTVKTELVILARLIKKIRLNKKQIAQMLTDQALYATELAEFLVSCKVAFKNAHTIVGKIVLYAENNSIAISEIPDRVLGGFHRKLNQKVIKKVMNPSYALRSRKSVIRRLPKV